jgi:hypothetical protein
MKTLIYSSYGNAMPDKIKEISEKYNFARTGEIINIIESIAKQVSVLETSDDPDKYFDQFRQNKDTVFKHSEYSGTIGKDNIKISVTVYLGWCEQIHSFAEVRIFDLNPDVKWILDNYDGAEIVVPDTEPVLIDKNANLWTRTVRL